MRERERYKDKGHDRTKDKHRDRSNSLTRARRGRSRSSSPRTRREPREHSRSPRRGRSRSASPRARRDVRKRSRSRQRHSRSRSPVRRHSRERRRSRNRDLRRSRSKTPTKKDKKYTRPVQHTAPKVTEEDLRGKTAEEQEMMKMMGFCNFDTTHGKEVDGNNVGDVHVILKRKYRQYMNRKGGFNRPLDFVQFEGYITKSYARFLVIFIRECS